MGAERERQVITVVYDSRLRASLNESMKAEEYRVESARDGLDAFHKLARTYFDVIITDIQMPGLGGADLLSRLKRIQPWARVIVVTARKLGRRERYVVESAADAWLEAPVDRHELRTAIQRAYLAIEPRTGAMGGPASGARQRQEVGASDFDEGHEGRLVPGT